MKNTPLLGGMTPHQFLCDYWHKKPLLVRNAIPGFAPLLSRESLFALAAAHDVESRLISRKSKQWQMQKGPVDEFPSISKKGWTLLVQGVNLHDDKADALLRQFRFLPDTRLDDLMISYATDTGGVGPHFDSYDVFLLQAHGQRTWRISSQRDLSLIEGMPLKILKNFTAEQEFTLDPGDMLYLPPHYAHDGIAVGECMTYSIGFRAPSYQELGEGFLQFMAESIELPGRYADPDLKPSTHPAEIGTDMLAKVAAKLAKVRFTDEDIAIFLGEYLSEPKPNVFFDPPRRMSLERFMQAVRKRGAALSRKTRMLYKGKHVFINGESFKAGREDKRPLASLADNRQLPPEEIAGISSDVMEALHNWYEDGWIVIGNHD